MDKPVRIVVAGQVPPPMGGQNVMVWELLEELRSCRDIQTGHLAFRFTADTQSARKGQFNKIIELIRVCARLFRIRLAGPIDVMVFPPGGPQAVPLFRDLLLLPWVLLLSRKTVLHFHAAGIADALKHGSLLARIVSRLYGRAFGALVMTDFNRQDPLACGVGRIRVIPHRLTDEFRPGFVSRDPGEMRLLAMGHLCADKGTPLLLAACGALLGEYPHLMLELAGEPLAPYTRAQLESDIEAAGMRGHVTLAGVVGGEAKAKVLGRAGLFVFPSKAPYESFGLVMVEAMMWGLPIVASDWRGNRDVLDNSPGAVTFAPADSRNALEDCLRGMLRKHDQWGDLGGHNRAKFLSCYSRSGGRTALAAAIVEMASSRDG